MDNKKLILNTLFIAIASNSILLNSSNSLAYVDSLNISDKKQSAEGVWEEGFAQMPTPRGYFSTAVVDGKIYCIGGESSKGYNIVEVYDPSTNTWESRAKMITGRLGMASVVVGKKIYCMGGNTGTGATNIVEVYDTETDTWSRTYPMNNARDYFSAEYVDGKIYILGGRQTENLKRMEIYIPDKGYWAYYNTTFGKTYFTTTVANNKMYAIGGSYYDADSSKTMALNTAYYSWIQKSDMPISTESPESASLEEKLYVAGGKTVDGVTNSLFEYNTITDTWSKLKEMPIAKYGHGVEEVNGKIYVLGGYSSKNDRLGTVEAYIAKVYTPEDYAEDKVEILESNINNATEAEVSLVREAVNMLAESPKKEELQNRLNNIFAVESITPKNISSNVDIYVKSENILALSLDTNSIVFEDFSGVENMEKINAVNMTISSSLPYELNAYLPIEIQNSDKSKTMDKKILNIKENSESDYKIFNNINEKLTLKDNNIAGNNIKHGVDLMLKGGISYEKGVYKTTVRFEVEQK